VRSYNKLNSFSKTIILYLIDLESIDMNKLFVTTNNNNNMYVSIYNLIILE